MENNEEATFRSTIDQLNQKMEAHTNSFPDIKEDLTTLKETYEKFILSLKSDLSESRTEVERLIKEINNLKDLHQTQLTGITNNISNNHQNNVNKNPDLPDSNQVAPKNREAEESKNNNGKIYPLDFYDGILQINGLYTLTDGWNITFKDPKGFKALIQNKGIALTVVGNYNKGKTFLIELLSGQKSPHGFSVSTEGISIKYLRDEKFSKACPIIALDTQGGSVPIKTVIRDEEEKEKKRSTPDGNLEAKKDTPDGNPVAKKDGNDVSTTKKPLTVQEIENRYKNLLRDHYATEDLLQNFIMETATIIIIVVSDLTFDDQRLISKIQNKFKKEKEKTLIVMHNLYNCETKIEVEGKIENLIKASFNLTEQHYFFPTNKNSVYYEEIRNDMRVIHLILGRNGTTAGEFYNETTIEYLKAKISGAPPSTIDIVKEFHNYLLKTLPSYVEHLDSSSNYLKVLEKDSMPNMIKMEGFSKMELKSISADELGAVHTFTEGYQPEYSIFREDKKIIMKIECPGKYNEPKVKLENNSTEFRINVIGQKSNDDSDEREDLTEIRKQGEFSILTRWIKKEKFDIQKGVTKSYNNGSIILEWGCIVVTDEFE